MAEDAGFKTTAQPTRPSQASGCASCSATRTARTSPSAARTRASTTPCRQGPERDRAVPAAATVENVEIRLHGTILYNSIYRADEQLLVNTHIFGLAASDAPVFHLRKIRAANGQQLPRKLRARLGYGDALEGPELRGRRIDYHDDPDEPKVNSMVPSVNVVVVNDAGEILLIRRSDNDNWALPGGAIDLGESVARRRSARPGKRPGSTARSPGWSASTPTRST